MFAASSIIACASAHNSGGECASAHSYARIQKNHVHHQIYAHLRIQVRLCALAHPQGTECLLWTRCRRLPSIPGAPRAGLRHILPTGKPFEFCGRQGPECAPWKTGTCGGVSKNKTALSTGSGGLGAAGPPPEATHFCHLHAGPRK